MGDGFFVVFLVFTKQQHTSPMDQDKELLRALIERRQEMLARMTEQIKNEHLGIDETLEGLLAAANSKMFFSEESEEPSGPLTKEN